MFFKRKKSDSDEECCCKKGHKVYDKRIDNEIYLSGIEKCSHAAMLGYLRHVKWEGVCSKCRAVIEGDYYLDAEAYELILDLSNRIYELNSELSDKRSKK